MIPTLFCYQVVLVGLVWLFFLLYWLGSTDPSVRGQTIAKPTLLRCKHPRERPPFMGLTRKPHCAACAQEAMRPKPPPPIPPDPLPATHRRPRTVDTSMHYCPQSNCTYHGWVGMGNLRANGHPNSGQERQF